eukprot:CAMPEP_0172676804 /NCGR_PEP_ID=MMETSP1074-20121228/14239_1 /TAXON_ID=2916 /ORGANISM="Ceratium fusus, Strain PA161109" /LENGTH=304 /DNA_ID=CAMNT_0013494541 /DNA_START=98 /DNA_END=1011 /DNA_ORIENTATION=-
MGCETSQLSHEGQQEVDEHKLLVLLRPADGRSSLKVWAAPHPTSAMVGTTPSGEEAFCVLEAGEYLRVQSRDLDGWVMRKDVVFLSDSEGGDEDDESAAACPLAVKHSSLERKTPRDRYISATTDELVELKDIGNNPVAELAAASRVRDGRVLLRQAEGRPSVLVRAWQKRDAVLVGEIPSGQLAQCLGQSGNFLQVRWHGLEGWVEQEDASSAIGSVVMADGPVLPPLRLPPGPPSPLSSGLCSGLSGMSRGGDGGAAFWQESTSRGGPSSARRDRELVCKVVHTATAEGEPVAETTYEPTAV